MPNQAVLAGVAKVDITPKGSVWMDGMPRDHESEGIHDPLFARALVVCQDGDKTNGFVLVSCDICGLDVYIVEDIRKAVSGKLGIPAENMIIACTHTHSGPAMHGHFNPKSEAYITEEFIPKVIRAISQAADSLRPAAIGVGIGVEDTISHYRRLWTKNNQIIMNWIEYPPEDIVGAAEEGDPEVGVVKIVAADDPACVIATLYNHAGHPNVMSGENFQISADYPGVASKIVEAKIGGTAMFLNGAQGSVDINGLKDRDWEGVARTGNALANVVSDVASKITPQDRLKLKVASRKFSVPLRVMTDEELSWAQKITAEASAKLETLADGVGDEWVATLFLGLHKRKGESLTLEMIGFALGDTAFVSFPGELFTEIGKNIKSQSPFKHTYIIDLANGCAGYFPTEKAIGEGGYAVQTRNCSHQAEGIITKTALDILSELAK